uniref:UmuC domain-containing protein n=1 Tax=Macrostomum lignano TaxID=282301 RepID=A0A1I8FIS5_9PLAT
RQRFAHRRAESAGCDCRKWNRAFDFEAMLQRSCGRSISGDLCQQLARFFGDDWRRRVILEAGPLRSLAEPAASAEKCGGGSGNGGCCGIECSDRSSSWQDAAGARQLSAISRRRQARIRRRAPRRPPPAAQPSRSPGQGVASHSRKRIAAANRAGSSGDGNDALVVEVNRCAPPPVSIRQDRRNLGEVNNNDERGGKRRAVVAAGRRPGRRVHGEPVSSTATVSMLTETSRLTRSNQRAAECRVPPVRKTFLHYGPPSHDELKRSGLNSGNGAAGRNGDTTQRRVRRRSGCRAVRLQPRQNTAFIRQPGVDRMVQQVESDAEQAAKRENWSEATGFECAVVIGTALQPAASAGQAKPLCLMDIGGKSCSSQLLSAQRRAIGIEYRCPIVN